MDPFAPILAFAQYLAYSIFRLGQGTPLGGAVEFFIFDTIKILLLLTVVIFFVSLLRSFIPTEKVKNFLARQNRLVAHLLASLVGVITPFCSCSAVPLFIGFVQAGVPLGVTFSFLVASPMINEVALILLIGLFGWQVGLLYLASGLLIAIVSGLAIGAMKLEGLVQPFVFATDTSTTAAALSDSPTSAAPVSLSWASRLSSSWAYTASLVAKVWPYIVIGVGVGAWIHGALPADLIARIAGADKWYGVPLATLIGVPLYSNAVGTIPVVQALFDKGVPLGTVLAFMMAVTALSLPEFLILRRVMRTRLIAIFATTVALGIMLVGYLFNWVVKV